MTTPIQWQFDLQEAMDVRDALTNMLRSNRNLRLSWGELKKLRDKLHGIVEQVGRAELDAETDEAYWFLFDALSYLTAAITGRFVDVGRVVNARDQLDKLFARGGEA